MALGFSPLSDGFKEFQAGSGAAINSISGTATGALNQAASAAQTQLTEASSALTNVSGQFAETAGQFTEELSSFQGDLSNLGNAALKIGNLNYDYDQAFSKLGNMVSNFDPSISRLTQAGLGSFGKNILGTATNSVMSWANGNNISAPPVSNISIFASSVTSPCIT